MGEVFPCPLCGRSANRKGRPFDDPEKTVAHIDGAHDEAHKGESGAEYRQDIRDNRTEREPGTVASEDGSTRGSDVFKHRFEFVQNKDHERGEIQYTEATLPDQVRLHSEMLVDPESFGIASERSVSDVNDRVDELEGQVDELESAIESLAGALFYTAEGADRGQLEEFLRDQAGWSEGGGRD